MAGIGRIISVAIPLLAAFGCGPHFDYVGHWKGKRDLKAAPGADDVVVRNTAKVVLNIKADGRFDLFDQGFPRSGTWHPSGGSAVLEVDQLLDERIRPGQGAPTAEVHPQPDGTLLYASEGSNIVLRRESQPQG